MIMSTISDLAASLGLPVFPCESHKRPIVQRWQEVASSDPETIRRMFASDGAAMIGMPTGKASGLVVIDVDVKNGAAGDAWLQENTDALPETRTHRTQSGGLHLVFLAPDGVEIRNSASRVAPGVDVRGEGGYVILPGSPGYTVADATPPAQMPQWLIRACLPTEAPKPVIDRPYGDYERYVQAAVDGEIAQVIRAGEGTRNATLNNAAVKLGTFVGAGAMTRAAAEAELTRAGQMCGLPFREVAATVKSGLDFGAANPRQMPERAPRAPKAAPRPAAPPVAEDARRPAIRVVGGRRHIAADEAIAAMMAAGVPFYQRDRSLVRVTSARAKTSDGSVIEVPGIVPVSIPILGRAMGQVAEWERMNAKDEVVRIDPPKEVVEQVAAMSGDWPFPPVAGVIGTPTMRPDGTILDREGYDTATGLVLTGAPRMPRIPDRPSRQDADRALEVLQSLLAEFPFVDDASRSVALSMILTVVLRGALLPAVPMHAATAPQPGTGKSYLADIASVIGTGERCAVIAMSPDVNETEKRLIAAALSGQQIIAIDNVSEIMAGDFLNQVTERPLLKIRPLGTSTDIRIPNTFTLFANGNNLSAPADMVRRTLLCQLDANVENPEARQFAGNPVADVMANRGHYVAAALTIGRAYVCAGYPEQLPPLASFERWSNLVRSALVWLGAGDPCKSMDMARAEDPIRAARAAVFAGWAKELGLNPGGFTVSQLVQEADAFDGSGFQCPTLREAILAVAAERTGTSISPKRFGKWLSANKNNVIAGLKLTANASDAARIRWILAKA